MLTNRILDFLISLTSWIVLPVQLVTTAVFGLLVRLTMGLLLIPFSLIWMVLYGIIFSLSYLYEKVPILRVLFSIAGIPISFLGYVYSCIIPSMGDFQGRFSKLLICQTFPYSWHFQTYMLLRRSPTSRPSEGFLELNIILKRISASEKGIGSYIDELMAKQSLDPQQQIDIGDRDQSAADSSESQDLEKSRDDLVTAKIELEMYMHDLSQNGRDIIPSFGTWIGSSRNIGLNIDELLEKYINEFHLIIPQPPGPIAGLRYDRDLSKEKLRLLIESKISYEDRVDQERFESYKTSLRLTADMPLPKDFNETDE